MYLAHRRSRRPYAQQAAIFVKREEIALEYVDFVSEPGTSTYAFESVRGLGLRWLGLGLAWTWDGLDLKEWSEKRLAIDRWLRLTAVPPEEQGEMLLLHLSKDAATATRGPRGSLPLRPQPPFLASAMSSSVVSWMTPAHGRQRAGK